MRLIIITQDEPFFLPEVLDYLLRRLPQSTVAVGCVLLSPSPFGKKERIVQKLQRTYEVFGARFLAHYLLRYAQNKLRRAPSVADVMAQQGVPILRLRSSINSEQSLSTIRALAPDLLISASGNEIFRRPLLELARHGCINLHAALLPKYRGLMPSFWILHNRERLSGVSVFLVDEGIDTGPILVQKKFAIGDMTQEQLIRHGKRLGMDAIIEAVETIARGGGGAIENNNAKATYFSFPTAKDVEKFRRAGARFY
jgi:methionyl-tRNA formyltransferase